MDVDLKKFEVPAEKLRWNCDPNIFDFECTKYLFGGYLSDRTMLKPLQRWRSGS